MKTIFGKNLYTGINLFSQKTKNFQNKKNKMRWTDYVIIINIFAIMKLFNIL